MKRRLKRVCDFKVTPGCLGLRIPESGASLIVSAARVLLHDSLVRRAKGQKKFHKYLYHRGTQSLPKNNTSQLAHNVS